jgi:hypothetical protein
MSEFFTISPWGPEGLPLMNINRLEALILIKINRRYFVD